MPHVSDMVEPCFFIAKLSGPKEQNLTSIEHEQELNKYRCTGRDVAVPYNRFTIFLVGPQYIYLNDCFEFKDNKTKRNKRGYEPSTYNCQD